MFNLIKTINKYLFNSYKEDNNYPKVVNYSILNISHIPRELLNYTDNTILLYNENNIYDLFPSIMDNEKIDKFHKDILNEVINDDYIIESEQLNNFHFALIDQFCNVILEIQPPKSINEYKEDIIVTCYKI